MSSDCFAWVVSPDTTAMPMVSVLCISCVSTSAMDALNLCCALSMTLLQTWRFSFNDDAWGM